MASNARERALALVSVLEPTDLVPCRILADLLAEMGTAPCVDAQRDDTAAEVGRPAHPDGWTTKALAEYYDCGVSTMRGRIEAGEFGLPESEGGPCKAGRRGWVVPHHQVLARHARVQGSPAVAVDTVPTAAVDAVPADSATVSSRPAPSLSLRVVRRPASSSSVVRPSLTDARRQRKAGSVL
jgi:hypothetical protein